MMKSKPRYFRWEVNYIDRYGDCRTTQTTADDRMEAIDRVSCLGKVVKAELIEGHYGKVETGTTLVTQ